MVIEESVHIDAPLDKVWKTFTDLACWQNWNSVMKDVSSGSPSIEKGGAFKFCLRPFIFPVNVEPFVEEVIPNKRVVWIGSKFGIFARHEFFFEESGGEATVRSRESFRSMAVDSMTLIFPERVIREMTRKLLMDLKKAAEKEN
jgi:uncharacterized protein YndB with AHSA1/START domain